MSVLNSRLAERIASSNPTLGSAGSAFTPFKRYTGLYEGKFLGAQQGEPNDSIHSSSAPLSEKVTTVVPSHITSGQTQGSSFKMPVQENAFQDKSTEVLKVSAPHEKSIEADNIPLQIEEIKEGRKRRTTEPGVFGKEARGLSVQTHTTLKKVLELKEDVLTGYPMPSIKELVKLKKIVFEEYNGKRPAECLKVICNELDLLEYMCKLYSYLREMVIKGKFAHLRKHHEKTYIEGYETEIEKLKRRLMENIQKIKRPKLDNC